MKIMETAMKKILLTAIMICAGTISANAVDFNAKILSVDGKPIPQSQEDQTPITLGRIAKDALIAPNLPGDTMTPDEKAARFFLAMKIADGKKELTAEEISLLKKVIGIAYGPLVVGRSIELLDPAAARR